MSNYGNMQWVAVALLWSTLVDEYSKIQAIEEPNRTFIQFNAVQHNIVFSFWWNCCNV